MKSVGHAATLALLLGALGAAWAQSPATGPKIFTCIDKNGRRLSSDRPIPECDNQDQKLLNRDGSVRAITRPLASAEELARQEEQRRNALQSQALQEEATRKDRQLLRRFPNELAHTQARVRAMEPVMQQLSESQTRRQTLIQERDALMQQIKVEKSPALAAGLRQRLEATGAALEAQSAVFRDRDAERERVSEQFDKELAHLKILWATTTATASGIKP